MGKGYIYYRREEPRCASWTRRPELGEIRPRGPLPTPAAGRRLYDVGSLGRFADGGHAPLEEVPTMLRRA
jgi:hypothetical protein